MPDRWYWNGEPLDDYVRYDVQIPPFDYSAPPGWPTWEAYQALKAAAPRYVRRRSVAAATRRAVRRGAR
jgi:hypothetical protein